MNETIYAEISRIIRKYEGYFGRYIADRYNEYEAGTITKDKLITEARFIDRKLSEFEGEFKRLRVPFRQRSQVTKLIRGIRERRKSMSAIIDLVETGNPEYVRKIETHGAKAVELVSESAKAIFKYRLMKAKGTT
jgi:hypothetical protein